MLRGFPKNMLENIRMQPSDALLATMLRRQKLFSESDFCLQRLKGEYMAKRLPDSLDIVGIKAPVNNYWLFPVLAVSIHKATIFVSKNLSCIVAFVIEYLPCN